MRLYEMSFVSCQMWAGLFPIFPRAHFHQEWDQNLREQLPPKIPEQIGDDFLFLFFIFWAFLAQQRSLSIIYSPNPNWCAAIPSFDKENI